MWPWLGTYYNNATWNYVPVRRTVLRTFTDQDNVSFSLWNCKEQFLCGFYGFFESCGLWLGLYTTIQLPQHNFMQAYNHSKVSFNCWLDSNKLHCRPTLSITCITKRNICYQFTLLEFLTIMITIFFSNSEIHERLKKLKVYLQPVQSRQEWFVIMTCSMIGQGLRIRIIVHRLTSCFLLCFRHPNSGTPSHAGDE